MAGKSWAKVRSLFDENSQAVVEAGPGTAVGVVGWKELPCAGELILEVESEVRQQDVNVQFTNMTAVANCVFPAEAAASEGSGGVEEIRGGPAEDEGGADCH